MKKRVIVFTNKKANIISIYAITILSTILILRLFYQPMINKSNSMLQKFWITKIGDTSISHGDFVVIKFHDFRMKNPQDYQLVVKEVVGVGGDLIKVLNFSDNIISHRLLLPNNRIAPVFRTLSNNQFHPLTTKDIRIPEGYYFLQGNGNPSFDSRYKEFGLISKSQIYGKAFPLF